jgi:hypothetical protein
MVIGVNRLPDLWKQSPVPGARDACARDGAARRDRNTISALMSCQINHTHAISLAKVERDSLAGGNADRLFGSVIHLQASGHARLP